MLKAIGLGILGFVFITEELIAQDNAGAPLEFSLRLENGEAVDQDDHCMWVHPTKPNESRIICSDKSAEKLFVYDLRGGLKQSLDVTYPGNIDSRQRVKLPTGEEIDVVLVNERESRPALHLFEVLGDEGKLVELGPPIPTGENYGCCLYYDKKKAALYGIITAKSGGIEQYLLQIDGERKLKGTKVRNWQIGFCEGAVADDDSGTIYIPEEDGIVWKFRGDPEVKPVGEEICRVGELGLQGNLEGATLLKLPTSDEKFLVISDQGRNRYVVLSTSRPAKKLFEFAIDKGLHTDGIAIVQAHMGETFPEGVMIAHTDDDRRQPLVVDIRKVLARIPKP